VIAYFVDIGGIIDHHCLEVIVRFFFFLLFFLVLMKLMTITV